MKIKSYIFSFLLILAVSVSSSAVISAETETNHNSSLNLLIELMNIFLNPAYTTVSPPSPSLISPTSTPSPTLKSPTSNFQPPTSNLQLPTSNFVYYPQCDGSFDNLPLPNGCNLCQAGCGPATTAMILSSYVDPKFTPPVVIDLFKQKSLSAGCSGTRITDNQKIINQSGLKTTDLLFYNDNEEAISDLKTYLKNGWTLFGLARFCDNGCGHYFWITEIDDNNNVWAYDPFYGRKQLPAPFNENRYWPFPKYRMAFGVKKP